MLVGNMPYRLGLDLGTNSIGWCIVELDSQFKPKGFGGLGVRIFPDSRNPKDGSSLAAARRLPRQARRNRDRYLRRQRRLMAALIKHGLMPPDETERKKLEALDPYKLRAEALDRTLSLHELGRAIFHLNQRRGFKSNRKTDGGDNDDSGKIKTAIAAVNERIAAENARTLGEYLWRRHREPDPKKRLPVLARLSGQGAKASYDLYADRAMIEHEFTALWNAQVALHGTQLTEAAKADIHDILFFQRPLRPVKAGRCALSPNDERAPWALPNAQRFRIFQELANLEIVNLDQTHKKLTQPQRDKLAAALLGKKAVTFKRMRILLGLDADIAFNLESEKRTELKGDVTAALLSKPDLFGEAWFKISSEKQSEIVEELLSEENEAALSDWLIEHCALDADAARRVSRASLPDGHCSLGRPALAKVVAELEKDVITYAEASSRAGYHHSDRRDGEIFDLLPYYGQVLQHAVAFGSGNLQDTDEKRFGKIANPTVHVALNQVRKVINTLIPTHGHPDQICVELARELKLSKKQKDEIKKEQAENQRRNDDRRSKLSELKLPESGENIMRLRLWEDLNPSNPADRRCPYTGEQISITRLFSSDVDIDHILPFSRTLDDGAANRTVCLRVANRLKTNRTPYEAFGQSPEGYDWKAIQERAAMMPKNKARRFAEDAMEWFQRENDFLARHLTDTQYLARIAKEYLGKVCDPDQVWATPGRLTSMMRGKWGLNQILSDHNRKNRTDHRHHAIDAAVVAVTDRGLLQEISRSAGRAEERHLGKLMDEMPTPWENFRNDLRDLVGRTIVSHKPDHGIQGALHNDTAYGFVRDTDGKPTGEAVHRVPLNGLMT
jgi:CRISPR-associated endonuclease Csn1